VGGLAAAEAVVSAPAPSFTARIRRRRRLWWRRPRAAGDWRFVGEAPHRLRERYAVRRQDDPESAWRCCALWQRTLIDKWNAREFAARHGCKVPALYWRARLPSRRLFAALPSHFVIRPTWGAHRKGVHVVADGRELLSGAPFSAAAVRRYILRSGPLTRTMPVLAEEFVRSDARWVLPLEVKFHTFGDAVAAIEVTERANVRTALRRYYTPDWQPIADQINRSIPQGPPRDPPACLDEMSGLARRIGTALGTYMRIDFFVTAAGPVFNEFASTPANGEHFTPFADEMLGGWWARVIPDAT
jgi:hypothetical protein